MTTFTDVFGSQTVPPSQEAYIRHTITASGILIWPENYSGTDLLVASITEISLSTALSINLPPASAVSTGRDILIRNVGSDVLTILDAAGGAVTTVAAGVSKYFYVTDNTTAAGVWSVFTYGAGTSGADANLLAGKGLQASANQLQTYTDYKSVNTDYTVLTSDRSKVLEVVSGSLTLTLPAASSAGNGYYVLIRNSSGGNTVVDGDSTDQIDRLLTKTLGPNESAFFVCNGSYWITVGYGRDATFVFNEVVVNAALTNITLTSSDVAGRMIRVAGTATANVTVTLPSIDNIYFATVESGVGGFNVTFKTAGIGTTVVLAANQGTALYSDGTNITTAINTVFISSLSFADGTALAPSVFFATDTDTGFFRAGSGQVGVTSNGTQVFTFTTEGTVVNTTGSVRLPVGTTAQRPAAVTGKIRFNSTTSQFEGSDDGAAFNVLGDFKYTQTGTGATPRRLSTILTERVSVKDFGAVGDGVTDDTTAFQNAANSITAGVVLVPAGKYVLNSSITLPAQVSLRGVTEAIGSARFATFDFTAFNCSLRLANAATINLGSGSCVSNLLVVNKNLVTAYPFANSAAALAAIGAFAGTAITGLNCQDVYLHDLRILGFAQAISVSFCDRTKIDRIDIDCNAGVLIDAVRDIDRICRVHCWPFVTYGYAFATSDLVYRRSGSAFKITQFFDGSGLFDCFSYGFTYGYELNATTGVTFQNCWVEGGGASYVAGQHGFHITGTSDQVNIIGGGVDTCDVGVYCNATGAKLGISEMEIFANNKGIEFAGAAGAFIQGNKFYYPHATGGGAPVAWPAPHSLIHVNGMAGSLNIVNNWLFGNSASPGVIFTSYTNNFRLTDNTIINCTTGISTDAATTATALIANNDFNGTTTPYSFGSATFTDKLMMFGNVGMASDSIGPQNANTINRPQHSNVSIGAGGGPRNYNYYATGSAGAKTIVANGNTIGSYRFYGYDGANYQQAVIVRGSVNGTPAANDMPGSFIVSTTPAASTTPVDRNATDRDGNFKPSSDNAYTCGANGSRWSAVWAANGTIQTSDAREKNVVSDVLGLDFINKLSPVAYTWKVGENRVVRQVFADSEGNEYPPDADVPDDAQPIRVEVEAVPGKRVHWGLLSQQVKLTMDELGVDFGGWVLTNKEDPDSQQALRYDQFIAPLIKAVQELSVQVSSLSSEIEILKGHTAE